MLQNGIIRDVKYPAIDGIRFYAAFVVLVMHLLGGLMLEYLAIPATMFGYQSTEPLLRLVFYVADGNHGVDIFFIISGFLMARIVLEARHQFSYAKFLANRFRRIYPAFFASLVITTIGVCILFGREWNLRQFVMNMAFLNAWPNLVAIPYNHVTWTLGYEFAFYLVIPVLLVLSRYADRRLVALLLLTVVTALIPTQFVRMSGLFTGALIGSFDDVSLSKLAGRIPVLLLFIVYVACGILKAFSTQVLPYYFSFVALASLLFVKIVWDDSNFLNHFFRSGTMRRLGTISFSIYLFHSIIGSVVLHFLTPRPPTWYWAAFYIVLSIALTIAAAYACYILIERRYFWRTAISKSDGESAIYPMRSSR